MHHDPAELFRGDLAGLPAPEVHRQLPGQGHDCAFALAGGGLGIEEHVFPALDGLALRLIADHAPGQFNQGPAHAGVAGLGDGQVAMAEARTADAAAQAGVTADLLAIVEAGPVAQFGDQHSQRERAQTFGPDLGRQRLDLLGQGVQLFLDGGDEFAPDGQPPFEPFRERKFLPPPFAAQADALGETKTAALGGQALAFAAELFALAGEDAALFLGGRGDADHTHGPPVAAQIAVQLQGQFAGIGLVGDDALVLRIEPDRMDDEGGDAQGGELAMELEAARPGFVNREHLAGQGELLPHEGQEAGGGEALGWLGRLAVAHPDDPEMIGVPVHAQFELVDWGLRFGWEERIGFHRHVALHV